MPTFMVDRMLEGLARRLRLAGYDCATPPEVFMTGQAILERARAEGRLLLTTARVLEPLAAPGELFLLPEAPLPDQLRIVIERYPAGAPSRAFTRCSRDNALLEEVDFDAVAAQLPPRVRQAGLRPVRRCPACGRLYWPGTHLDRIRRNFKAWTGREI